MINILNHLFSKSVCSFSANIFDYKDIGDVSWFNLAVSFVERLVNEDIDSVNGIKIVVDAPAGNIHMLNVIRPGVMRQEYGLTLKKDPLLCPNRRFVPRFFYGISGNKSGYSPVGTHPKDQYTMPMDDNLKEIAKNLLIFVKNSKEFELVQKAKLRKYSKIEFDDLNY